MTNSDGCFCAKIAKKLDEQRNRKSQIKMRKSLTFADGWRKRYLSRKLFGAKNPVLRLRLILIKKNIFGLTAFFSNLFDNLLKKC